MTLRAPADGAPPPRGSPSSSGRSGTPRCAGCRRAPRVVGTPTTSSSPSARRQRGRSRGPILVPDDDLRRAASRSSAERRRRPRCACRRARRGRAAAGTARSAPAPGRKPRAGSSALMRTSIAWPRRSARPVAPSGSPAAIRSCSRTRSMPVTSSRHRMLDLEPRVQLDEVERAVGAEQELERAGVPVADRARGPLGGRLHRLARLRRRAPATATPRSASGGGAGSSTRARPA